MSRLESEKKYRKIVLAAGAGVAVYLSGDVVLGGPVSEAVRAGSHHSTEQSEIKNVDRLGSFKETLNMYTTVGPEIEAIVNGLSDEEFNKQFTTQTVATGTGSELKLRGLGQDKTPLEELNPAIRITNIITGNGNGVETTISAYLGVNGPVVRTANDVFTKPLSEEEMKKRAGDFAKDSDFAKPDGWNWEERVPLDPASDATMLVKSVGNTEVLIDPTGAVQIRATSNAS